MKIETNATTNQNLPRPTEILLHQASNVLELAFGDEIQVPRIRLSAEYLRINSPSAEVQGHSAAERILVASKQAVGIAAIHPVGNYAILLEFSDGHRTGIFSFGYLVTLANEHAIRWPNYLEELRLAGLSR